MVGESDWIKKKKGSKGKIRSESERVVAEREPCRLRGGKKKQQKREVSEWEKENLIVFLAMER